MARSALFSLLKEAVQSRHLTRRQFLFTSALAAAGVGLLSTTKACWGMRTGRRRVVVVGAGLAGLNAAWQLRKAGVEASVYEGSGRVGGRVHTLRGHFGGLVTELGGEFIDSTHEDLLALCQEFHLPLWDRAENNENSFEDRLVFEGRAMDRGDITRALAPLEGKIRAEIERLTVAAEQKDWAALAAQDAIPLSTYFDSLGVSGWFRRYLEVAYLAEFGLECEQQSSLNFLFLFDPKVAKEEGEAYGPSDERFKIQGGNESLAEALGARCLGIHLQHRLLSLEAKADGSYELRFGTGAGEAIVEADYVVLALPFTALRHVKLRLPLDADQRKAIAELGYGQNTKLILGFRSRFWRKGKSSGELLSDAGFHACWDSSRFQKGRQGTLTLYSAGQKALDVGDAPLDGVASAELASLGSVWPTATRSYNGQKVRFDWTRSEAGGSYACCKPGQWMLLHRLRPDCGNVFFAGEQLALEFQGYMNGALATGRQAAERIIGRVSQG